MFLPYDKPHEVDIDLEMVDESTKRESYLNGTMTSNNVLTAVDIVGNKIDDVAFTEIKTRWNAIDTRKISGIFLPYRKITQTLLSFNKVSIITRHKCMSQHMGYCRNDFCRGCLLEEKDHLLRFRDLEFLKDE